MKTNVDESGRISRKTFFVGYVIRDSHDKIMMARGKAIGDYLILIAECLAVLETIILTIHKDNQMKSLKILN